MENDPQVAQLLAAQTPVVTIFGKSWRLHVTEVLGIEPAENRAMIADTVRHLKAHGREVIYDAEHFFDGYKDDPAHALATLAAARDGGADLLVLCDTNGGCLPEEVEAIFRAAAATCPAPLGIHTHNDCGLGVANALAAVRAGAVQVQGTVNGYGERTGNCNLTTVIPCLQAKMGLDVVADLPQLTELSYFVDELANCPHDPRAPFIGSTAFAHKGGVHVHAVQKLARSYEHMDPAAVGNRQHILVSELSGQSNVLAKAQALGFTLSKGSPEVAAVLAEIKRLEKDGYEFEAAEASFELLVRKQLGLHQPLVHLAGIPLQLPAHRQPAVRDVRGDGETARRRRNEYTVAEGDGPVNALDAAVRKALRPFYPQIDGIALQDYKVRIIDSHQATAARTRVLIVSSDGHEAWSTVGVSGNIIEASWLALIDGLEYKLGSAKRSALHNSPGPSNDTPQTFSSPCRWLVRLAFAAAVRASKSQA